MGSMLFNIFKLPKTHYSCECLKQNLENKAVKVCI